MDLHQNTSKNIQWNTGFLEHGLGAAVPGSLKNILKGFHLWFPCTHCRRRDVLGTLLSSSTLDRSFLPLFPSIRPSRAVAICGSADWDLFIYRQCVLVIHHVLFFQFGNSLTTFFHDRGRGGPTAWPAEITYIFHPLRRHPKSILYSTEVDDIRDLQQRMQN